MSERPDAGQEGAARSLRLGLVSLSTMVGREGDVLGGGEVGEEVEALEHHAHFLADLADVRVGARDAVVLDPDLARVEVLQPVHAAQERALARARGADDEDDLALGYLEVHAPEGLDGAELLPGVLYPNYAVVHGSSASFP